MYLKSLTLRGFKSFADRTVFDLQPGITVVVGPNGSGKSNVVDALIWVLGTGSAKSLRGASMADVVFAGSRGARSAGGRAAMGRAAVEITIDNSDQTLPVEFTEVTIGRTTFANGETSYSINGVECRLLDVEELLSDTGLGRLSHTIVGQGRLDAILAARPEDRRAFIEEAAGILKHRRRKERALRKLAQMEGHAERLDDLVRELRRQIRPLERQAEAAARYDELVDSLRAVRCRRAARELATLTAAWASCAAEQEATQQRRAALEAASARQQASIGRLEMSLAASAPQLRAAEAAHMRVVTAAERLQGLVDRIAERRSALQDVVDEPVAERDAGELRSRADEEQAHAARLAAEEATARRELERRSRRLREIEQARRAFEQAVAAATRRQADVRERRLRWEGEVRALRSALSQAAGEEGRVATHLAGLQARCGALKEEVHAARRDADEAAAAVPAAQRRLDAARSELQARRGDTAGAVERERELERRHVTLGARIEALQGAAREPAEALAAVMRASAEGRIDGLLGSVAELVSVKPGAEGAVAAALGPLAEAVAVGSAAAAHDAAAVLRAADAGRGLLLVTDVTATAPKQAKPIANGAQPLFEALDGEPQVVAALRLALADVWRVEDLAVALRLAGQWPTHTFVTADGEVVGRAQIAAGALRAGSPLLARAAADAARNELAEVRRALEQARFAVAAADRAAAVAQEARDEAAAALQQAETRFVTARERLQRLERDHCGREQELRAARQRATELQQEVNERRRRLARLEQEGPPESDDPEREPVPDGEAERLDRLLAEARDGEVEARLALGACQQRAAEHRRRGEALLREADEIERRLVRRRCRREERLAALERCDALARVAEKAVARAQASLVVARRERDDADEARARREQGLSELRTSLRSVEAELANVAESGHADELRRAELRLRLDGAGARARELGLDPENLPEDTGDQTDAQLAEREDSLSRQLGLIGAVNQLARQELAAAQERHAFLSKELDDLRASRRDLLQIVSTVDERIQEIFAAAFADVAAAFARIFPRLFPGGEGRLVLTDPDDLLNSGIEVEARPPGKRVKRLSLLSGGERSLTALAVLFAIFTARPSPFYVLDEVEAALDDVNLQRFLDVVVEFGHTSQLVIVTHQRLTMEIAGTLYGVSMRSDGVSRVVSQRVGCPQEVQPAHAVLGAQAG